VPTLPRKSGGEGGGGGGGITLPQAFGLALKDFVEMVFSGGLTIDTFIEQGRLQVMLGFPDSDGADQSAQGDIIYRGATAWARLPAGTSGDFLKTQGAGANPLWAPAAGGAGVYELFLDFGTREVSVQG